MVETWFVVAKDGGGLSIYGDIPTVDFLFGLGQSFLVCQPGSVENQSKID